MQIDTYYGSLTKEQFEEIKNSLTNSPKDKLLFHAMENLEWHWYEKQDSKLCSKCYYNRPIEYFRRMSKETGERHTICKICRKKYEQDKLQKKRRDALKAINYDIRRSFTIEKVYTLIQACAERLGGPEQIAREWVKMIQDDQTPDASRIKAFSTLVYATKIAEEARIKDDIEQNPVTIALMWHEQQWLIPLIRAFLDDGLITLDDIDPPPSEYLT